MLNYDFDILQLVPTKSVDAEAEVLRDMLDEFAAAKDPTEKQVALFRDPVTTEALRNAPEGLRDFFLASGFGLNTYDSGAPAGHYPEGDEDARIEVINSLAKNAASYVLPSEDNRSETDFALDDFLQSLTSAQPWSCAFMAEASAVSETPEAELPDQRAPNETRLTRLPVMLSALAKLGIRKEGAVPVDPAVQQPEAMPKPRFWQGKGFLYATMAAAAGGGLLIPQAIAQL